MRRLRSSSPRRAALKVSVVIEPVVSMQCVNCRQCSPIGGCVAAAQDPASRTKEIQVVKLPLLQQENPMAARAGCVRFACLPEGRSVKSQSGRQDSNLRPSAPKALERST